MRVLSGAALVAALFLLPAVSARAQSPANLSLYGTVTIHNQEHEPGDRVMLYDRATGAWIGPALTDNEGVYRFYGLAHGSYVIALYLPDSQNRVFTANVDITAERQRQDIVQQ